MKGVVVYFPLKYFKVLKIYVIVKNDRYCIMLVLIKFLH